MMSHPKTVCVLVLIKKILNDNIQWRPTHNPQRKENFLIFPLFIAKTEFCSSYFVVFRFMGFYWNDFFFGENWKIIQVYFIAYLLHPLLDFLFVYLCFGQILHIYCAIYLLRNRRKRCCYFVWDIENVLSINYSFFFLFSVGCLFYVCTMLWIFLKISL